MTDVDRFQTQIILVLTRNWWRQQILMQNVLWIPHNLFEREHEHVVAMFAIEREQDQYAARTAINCRVEH